MNENAWSRVQSWARVPPLMQRTLGDDLKVGASILVGAALACLLFKIDASALIATAVGIVLVTAVLNVVRHVTPRRKS